MIRLLRPSAADIAAALDAASGPDEGPDERCPGRFSHAEVGATANPSALAILSGRYAVNHRRFSLGRGAACYEAARSALFAWRHFEIPWLELHGGGSAVRPGQVVATLTRAFGLWFLNPCRVVYREDAHADSAPSANGAHGSSFAYGTLTGHVACGEERFSLVFDPATGDVCFEILAFSRPAIALTRLGRPFMRRIQRRFAIDSANALARACGCAGATEIPPTNSPTTPRSGRACSCARACQRSGRDPRPG